MTDPAPTDDSPAAKRRRFVDLTPLRESPAFARLYFGSAISGIGAQLTIERAPRRGTRVAVEVAVTREMTTTQLTSVQATTGERRTA